MDMKVKIDQLSIKLNNAKIELIVQQTKPGMYRIVMEKYAKSSPSQCLAVYLTDEMTAKELMHARKTMAIRMPTFWSNIRKEAKDAKVNEAKPLGILADN